MTHKVRVDFNSVDEFCNVPFKLAANESKCRREFQALSGRWLERSRYAQEWLGAPTYEEAAERVTKGWKEGAEEVLRRLADIDIELPLSVRRKLSRADQGDELDIHSVYAGNLDRAWTRRVRKHTRTPLTVRIVVQTNLLAGMKPEELFWRGAAAVKLSDLLTTAGYNVEIVGALASEKVCGREGVDFLATMMLKESKAPLDIEQLAGVICNAGFHRLFGFRGYMAIADWVVSSEPGASMSARDGRVIKEGGLDADGVMTFTTPYAVKTKEAAQKFIEECCAWLNQPQELMAT
jgi:hypothetical protein